METVLDNTATTSSTKIDCVNCIKSLPLTMSRAMEESSVWLCAGCGMSFVGLADTELLQEQGRLVRLHEQYFDVSYVPDIPKSIRRHIASQATRSLLPAHLEKRRSERIYNSMVIQAVEMDQSFVVRGKPMKVILTDISREGVGLAIPQPIDNDLLAIKFPITSGNAIQAIVRVNRQRELSHPFVEVGCEFVTRLGD
jgi:hypothetical protein